MKGCVIGKIAIAYHSGKMQKFSKNVGQLLRLNYTTFVIEFDLFSTQIMTDIEGSEAVLNT